MWIYIDDEETAEVEVEIEWEGPDVCYIDVTSDIPEGFNFEDVERAVLSQVTRDAPRGYSWMVL